MSTKNFFFLFNLFFIPLLVFAQTPSEDFQKAITLIQAKKYSEGIALLETLLQRDPNNRDYQNALRNGKKNLDIQTAQDFTEQSLDLVTQEKYTEAQNLLKKALALDPNNKEAAEMYISLTDLVKAEQESVNRLKNETEEKALAEEKAKFEEQARIETQQNEEKAKANIVLQAKILERRKSFVAFLGLTGALTSTTATQDMLDTGAYYLGTSLGFTYFLPFMVKRPGINLEYFGALAKISGDEWISRTVHTLDFSLLYRVFFLEDLLNSSEVETSLGYVFFIAPSDQGLPVIYPVSLMGAPALGVKISDPLISHFFPGELWRRLNFFLGAKGSIVPKQTGNLIYLKTEVGGGFLLDEIELSLKWDGQFFLQGATDAYHYITLGASLKFS